MVPSGPLFTLRPRDSISAVNDVVAVGDGGSIASGSSDGYLRLWDMVTRRPSVSISTGVDPVIGLVEPTGVEDSHRIGVQTKAKTLSLWDVAHQSGKAPIWSIPIPKAYTFCKAVPLRDSTIACPLTESDIGIIDSRTGVVAGVLQAPTSSEGSTTTPKGAGSAVAVRQLDDEGGNGVVVVYESGRVALFDTRRLDHPCAESHPHEMKKARGGSGSTVTCMERLANELWVGTSNSYISMLAAGRVDEEYSIEEVGMGNSNNFLHVEEASVGIGSMAVRSDLRLLAAGLWDGRIILIDVKTRTLLGDLPRSHDASITKVTFLPDNRFVAASTDGRLSVWNTYQDTVV